jgi:membrane-associated phospholipid phosphatase
MSSLAMVAFSVAGFVPSAYAQTAANLNALKGLAPFSVLGSTAAGKAALASNYEVTGAIQTGTSGQPALQPFPAQQAQALKDAFITAGNAYEFADGLGSKLGGAYQSLTTFTSTDDGKTKTGIHFTNVSPKLASLIAYSFTRSAADSAAAKLFFANQTTDGKTPVSPETAAIMTAAGGGADVFGKAYGYAPSSPGPDPYGDPRPFQTEKTFTTYTDPDFFGQPSGNTDYLSGPAQKLETSPSFPSGHTTYGYTESLLLALLLPERYQQMITRGAEYGNSRIVVGAHYAMDVIGGRTLAYYDIAQLLANNPAYVGQTIGKAKSIADYPAALQAARADLVKALAEKCGSKISVCAKQDTSRFSNQAANAAFYESTQTYGLPVVYPQTAGKTENVAKIAPEAGYLLTAAFPRLTLAEADHILTSTEGPGGGFLDNGSAFGVYSRLDLYKAAGKAAALSPPG